MSNKIVGIKHILPLFGTTDFCHFARKYILKLIDIGIPTTIESIDLVSSLMYSSIDQKIFKCLGNKVDYNVTINWLHPLDAIKYLRTEEQKNTLKIVFSDEEADVLYRPWALLLNTYSDIIFVPGNITRNKYSNVIKPVNISYYPVDITDFLGSGNDIKVVTDRPLTPQPEYIFYSNVVFNNTHNLETLLISYYNTFSDTDSVCLLLLSTITTNQAEDFIRFKTLLSNISLTYKKKLPKLLVSFDPSIIQRIASHRLCNCYINVEKTTNFNLECIRSVLTGNCLITHDYDDTKDYGLTDNIKHYTSDLVTPQTNELQHYNEELHVIKPNIESLSNKMLEAFKNLSNKTVDKNKVELLATIDSNYVINSFLSTLSSYL